MAVRDIVPVFERTREIGLLRAVGMRRRQVRAMVRSEAVILAIFGAIVGIVIGTALGEVLTGRLRDPRPCRSVPGMRVLQRQRHVAQQHPAHVFRRPGGGEP